MPRAKRKGATRARTYGEQRRSGYKAVTAEVVGAREATEWKRKAELHAGLSRHRVGRTGSS
jgi:hypothetical protein